FSACVVVERGQVVDGVGGTAGPIGWRSAGSWDGEAAYLLSPLAKKDLFGGGASFGVFPDEGLAALRESLIKSVAGLRAVTPFEKIILSGKLLQQEADVRGAVMEGLESVARVQVLEPLSGAWVKQAAQGAAVMADGLAVGAWQPLVDHLAIRQA